jgi:endo-1,4-beta-xylanase
MIYILSISIIVLFPVLNFAQICPGSTRFLGCATSEDIWRYYDSYWNQLTPGNACKWGSVESIKGQYSWTNLDKIYNFAVKRNFPFKEHTLVWGSQEPSWISSLDSVSQRAAVENWFELLGERYPLMALADVVNEPFHAVPSYKNALGGDGTTGWDWIITAFELARKYLPADTKLLINEYNVLHDYNITTNYISLINLLKD